MSDETTQAYLASLEQWVWSGYRRDLESLDPFQQFLVLTSRCEIIAKQMPRPSTAELFGIWMETLDVKRLVLRSKVVNRYHFGETSIGQLFIAESNSSTGRQIRFSKESEWKIEAIALMKEVYEASASRGNHELLKDMNSSYFQKGYISQ